jgi:hypothetical protein
MKMPGVAAAYLIVAAFLYATSKKSSADSEEPRVAATPATQTA